MISHEKEATKRLFASVRYFIDNLEIKPTLSIDSKSELKFPKSGSNYFIGTAGQKAFGRGDTVDRAHLSEASFYSDLEMILGGITEAAEYGQIDIETTPNGRDQFYDLWEKAKTGKSPYTNIFIPWFIDQEYSSDSMTEEEKQGLSVGIQELFAIPDEEFLADLNKEEKDLVARVAEDYGFVLTAGQLKWRRYKIWDKGELFYQEYPEDDESCFLQSGRAVFKKITLDKTKRIPIDDDKAFEAWAKNKWTDKEERDKRIKQFKSSVLFAGVDCAEGIIDGDNHCFSVIFVNPEDGKAYVIYEYASNEDIDVFWDKINKIVKDKDGNYRFKFFIGIEKQGVGVAHVNKAKSLRIKFKEWNTTSANRSLMVSNLEEGYRKEELIETYTEAETEARNMIYNSSNKAEHQQGKHDDRIFARAIAWQLTKLPIPRVTSI